MQGLVRANFGSLGNQAHGEASRSEVDPAATVLAATLGIPYQKLRRLEIGTRSAAVLEHQAHTALDPLTPRPCP